VGCTTYIGLVAAGKMGSRRGKKKKYKKPSTQVEQADLANRQRPATPCGGLGLRGTMTTAPGPGGYGNSGQQFTPRYQLPERRYREGLSGHNSSVQSLPAVCGRRIEKQAKRGGASRMDITHTTLFYLHTWARYQHGPATSLSPHKRNHAMTGEPSRWVHEMSGARSPQSPDLRPERRF